MYGCPCRQSIFRSYNIHFQSYAFWWRSFHMPVWKRTHKGLRVSNVALLWVVFKWRHGSKGVKDQIAPTCNYMLQHLAAACWKSQTQAAKQLLGHTKILHTLVGMGRVRVIWSLTPRAAAVPYPGNVTWISHKGQWSIKLGGEKSTTKFKL